MTPRYLAILLLICVPLIAPETARGEEAFYRIPVAELTFTEAQPPGPATQPVAPDAFTRLPAMRPAVVIDGAGEAVVTQDQSAMQPLRTILIRVPQAREVTGRIFLSKPDGTGMQMSRFSIPADKADPEARQAFYEAQLAHYESLLSRDIPGGAWFRFRAQQARDALRPAQQDARRQPPRRSWDPLDDTFALFTGGRAVSENLQLDRVIDPPQDAAQDIPVGSIRGITVAEIDWTPLVAGLDPKLDPLASYIPADQHAAFFANLDAAKRVLGAIEQAGTPVLDILEVRHEDLMLLQRYERQLGVTLHDLAETAAEAPIASIAVTGSDPYFRTGTDVAVLIESVNPQRLLDRLLARVEANSSAVPGAKRSTNPIDGVTVHVTRCDDRAVSSYAAVVGNAVALSNSPAQLRRILDARRSGQVLSKLPEYTFFRHRYALGDDDDVFVILSDATIRRWCGPAWRIADSRRTRAAARMADDEMRALAGAPPATQPAMPTAAYGSRAFLTPILELEIANVSEPEKLAYQRWREAYQANWQWAFDPIAARITVRDEQLSADVSVIPLIFQTDYRDLIEMTRGVKIDPAQLDSRAALMTFAIALDAKSRQMQSWGLWARNLIADLDVDPFAWMGPTLSVHWYDDNRWRARWDAGMPRQTPEPSVLPLALKMQTVSAMRLVAFLTAARAFIEQTAPGMTRWESREHDGQAYVRVSEAGGGRGGGMGLPFSEFYYAATPQALVIATDEKILQEIVGPGATTQRQPATRPLRPWLGSSVCLQLDARFFDEVLKPFGLDVNRSILERRRTASWENLIILNELRQHFPAQDARELYEKHWHAQLVCPGGGQYVWNEQWQTMESTVFGSPSNPKPGPTEAPLAEMFDFLNMGITFEDQGLRARATIDYAPRK